MTSATPDVEHVWEQLHTNLRAFVSRRLPNEGDVDDVVQRVFLQAHRALPALRDGDRVHAWMYQMTRHAIADYYRAPARRREVPSGDILDVAGQEAPAPTADAAQRLSASGELASCLQPLLDELSAGDRTALELVDVQGLTQVEVARRIGLSVSGMKSRVQRARARLRAVVEECCRLERDRRGGIIAYESRSQDACGTCRPRTERSPAERRTGGI